MATVLEMEAQLERLLTARAQGELTVEYDGRRVTMKSGEDLNAAIGDLRRRIASASGTVPIRTIRINSSKGI